ncbi:MAG: hypothetical protein R6X22_11545 [Gemmatimonadota bacterium]
MNRLIATMTCALFACAALPGSAAAQDPLVGDWDVAVSVMAQEIPLVLHIAEGEGGLEGTFDSPAQGAFGLPILAIAHEHPAIRVELETGGAPAVLEGTHAGDTISGDFSQGPLAGTFEATRKAPEEGAAEPETPDGGR